MAVREQGALFLIEKKPMEKPYLINGRLHSKFLFQESFVQKMGCLKLSVVKHSPVIENAGE